MSWFLVDKASGNPNRHSSYKAWKEDLRHEGRRQCVYCCVREGSFGGYRNFHVEHYRPKSLYSALADSYQNLFYACAICNSFKSDAWPGDPNEDLSNPAFPDPSKVDYSTFMSVAGDGTVVGSNVSAMYTVERLYLNRPQLVVDRRLRRLELRFLELLRIARGFSADDRAKVLLAPLWMEASELLVQMRANAPYEPSDIRRA